MANSNPEVSIKASLLIDMLMDELDLHEIFSLMIDSNDKHMEECKGNDLKCRQEEHVYLVKFRDLLKSLRLQQKRELGV